jgi:hypothetical protein
MAEVVVRIRCGQSEATGQAASTDSIEASLKAYLSAVGSVHSDQPAASEAPRAGARAGAA